MAMKLSEIKGEAAIDALADMLEPIAKIAGDKGFLKEYRSKKPKIMLVKYLLKYHRHSVLEILAILDQKPFDEYMETVNLITLPQQILEMINDPEIAVLFQSQSQTDKTSFGSVTESTEASEE